MVSGQRTSGNAVRQIASWMDENLTGAKINGSCTVDYYKGSGCPVVIASRKGDKLEWTLQIRQDNIILIEDVRAQTQAVLEGEHVAGFYRMFGQYHEGIAQRGVSQGISVSGILVELAADVKSCAGNGAYSCAKADMVSSSVKRR